MHLTQLPKFALRRQSLTKSLKLLMVLPLVAGLASCGQVHLDSQDKSMSNPDITTGSPTPLPPSDTPSSADGKVVFDRQNCASCHSAGGSAVAKGIDFTNTTYMDKQKPVDQYMMIAYGSISPSGKDKFNHPVMSSKLTSRQMWDLTFYCRSLARPVITSNNPEYMAIDAVFGSNCVVCHGKKGNGDGPLAHNLEPVPANFANFARFYDRSDDVLWDHIANGIKWEGMPNFLNKTDKAKIPPVKFDKDYIWKLVQYVRHFQSTDQPTLVAESNKSQESSAQSSTSAPTSGNKGENQK
ncbi:MAG TPA: c-type cytochrome [Trichormus sp.]